MAAGSILAALRPRDLHRETSVGYDAPYTLALYTSASTAATAGTTSGIRLNKLISSQLLEYYNAHFYVPALIALGTGLTFKFFLCDDGTSAADLGKVVQLEVTPFNLSTASAPIDWTLVASRGTVTTGNATLSATSGVLVVCTIAIVAANLASLAAGGIFGFRLRRVGDNVADTCAGPVMCTGGVIYDT